MNKQKAKIYAEKSNGPKRPPWLSVPVPAEGALNSMEALLRRAGLNTVCEEALCPNMGECFGRGTATFMILGSTCTRNCRFCAVKKGLPRPPKKDEPRMVAEAVVRLGLKHVVITSVTRDDLADGGAAHFARAIKEVHNLSPGTRVEVLIPDFQGNAEALELVASARPGIIGHNIETVPRLYSLVRPRADYRRSLEVLAGVKRLEPGIIAKSGIMLGMGESASEVMEVLKDLREAGCGFITMGQYLQSTKRNMPVREYITPETFADYSRRAEKMGFSHVVSTPLARSSYHAEEAFFKKHPCGE
ncbi:MAG: lipoyl synthase [Desulfocucumaceae bacterium]